MRGVCIWSLPTTTPSRVAATQRAGCVSPAFDRSQTVTSSQIAAGLYGERVGALSFVLSDDGAAKRVLSQLKRIARAIYSNPPVHGARIVAEVVGNEDMFTEWKQEMEGMAGRIKVSIDSPEG